jgi:hypothetical protein
MIKVDHELEYNEALLAINFLLQESSGNGKKFFKYLFKSLEIGETIPMNLPEPLLREISATHRTANSIYKLILNANPSLCCEILAEIEKERQNEQRTIAK